MIQRMIYTQAERRIQALNAGLKLAQQSGVKGVSVSAVARECEVTAPLLFHIFGTRDKFHDALRREARKKKIKLPTDAKKPAVKKAATKKAATKKAAPAKKSRPSRKATKKAPAGQNAAAKRAGTGKRFKMQAAPATADVATPGDAPAA